MALIEKLTTIADAIRSKTGKADPMTLDQMATEIAGISAGGSSDMEEQWIAAIERDSSNPVTKLPDGLTSIGDYAFYYAKIATIEPPTNVTSIGDYAFGYVTDIGWTSLPNGLTQIGKHAFVGCSNLSLTSLPEDLGEIKNSTFQKCEKLALTELPQKVSLIGSWAFYGCTALTKLTLKSKPKSFAGDAFLNCTNLTTINVPWAEGEVSGAPWGATNATINYNYTGE